MLRENISRGFCPILDPCSGTAFKQRVQCVFRFLKGVNRVFNKKAFPEALMCVKDSHDGRVICAAQHCKMFHVQDLAVQIFPSGNNELPSGNKCCLCEFPSGNKIIPRETRNSLRGTSIVFGITNNFFWGNILSFGKV